MDSERFSCGVSQVLTLFNTPSPTAQMAERFCPSTSSALLENTELYGMIDNSYISCFDEIGFSKWLRSKNGIFWVSDKAGGSGKSVY
jgi:hypothetical protein